MPYILCVASTFLSTREVAEACDVHENTIYQWVRKGVLTPVRVHDSARYRFRPEDVAQVQRRLGLLDPEHAA